MDAEQEFDRRIAEIHGLGEHARGGTAAMAGLDVRHAEFHAMVESFLGKNYDQTKINQIEELQTEMVGRQARLAEQYQRAEIGPSEYVDRFNAMANATFDEMKRNLGEEDFIKLFGPPPDRSMGMIDKETFIKAHQERTRVLKTRP